MLCSLKNKAEHKVQFLCSILVGINVFFTLIRSCYIQLLYDKKPSSRDVKVAGEPICLTEFIAICQVYTPYR